MEDVRGGEHTSRDGLVGGDGRRPLRTRLAHFAFWSRGRWRGRPGRRGAISTALFLLSPTSIFPDLAPRMRLRADPLQTSSMSPSFRPGASSTPRSSYPLSPSSLPTSLAVDILRGRVPQRPVARAPVRTDRAAARQPAQHARLRRKVMVAAGRHRVGAEHGGLRDAGRAGGLAAVIVMVAVLRARAVAVAIDVHLLAEQARTVSRARPLWPCPCRP